MNYIVLKRRRPGPFRGHGGGDAWPGRVRGARKVEGREGRRKDPGPASRALRQWPGDCFPFLHSRIIKVVLSHFEAKQEGPGLFTGQTTIYSGQGCRVLSFPGSLGQSRQSLPGNVRDPFQLVGEAQKETR